MFAWIKDRLSSAPNKFRITNTVADYITLHRCRTPKGPRAERLFGDGGVWCKNELHLASKQEQREEEREQNDGE